MNDICDRGILFSDSYFSTTAYPTFSMWKITMDSPDGIPFQVSLKWQFCIYMGAINWIPDTLGYLNGCLFIWHHTSSICLVYPIAFNNWLRARFKVYIIPIFYQNIQATFMVFNIAFMPT